MIVFAIIFSVAFFVIRRIDIIPMHVLLSETNGVGMLYSAIGLIFGIISAFVIQTQWENWNKLTISVHEETKSLRHLLLFSQNISAEFHAPISLAVKKYVTEVIANWYGYGEEKSRNGTVKAMEELRNTIYSISDKKSNVLETANQISLSIISYHDDIIHYGSRKLPTIIKILIICCLTLVIILPLFVGIRTLWLDYIITLSIALLAFLIYLVIIDLDRPLKHGNWHITTSNYQKLLDEID